MSYILLGGFAVLATLAVYQYLRRVDRRTLFQGLRWLVGGGAGLLAALLLLARRFDLAFFAAAAAVSVLRTGRLGPFSFDSGPTETGNISKVRSRYFAMELDHDTGTVEGRVLAGQFSGYDLIDLGEDDTRALLVEIAADTDSLSLLESWLDANRAGWREYFAETDNGSAGSGASSPEPIDDVAQAYEVLGLKSGASDEDVKTAHRELMKAVHPDHGGSSYLASKINEARDRLLRR